MYLCPAGVALLERLRLHRRVEASARRLRGMVLVSPGLERLETRFPGDGAVPDHGLALSRPALDNALLEAARESGVDVRMGFRAEPVRWGGGWRTDDPGCGPVEARLLVGADGRKSSTARRLGLSRPVHRARAAIHIDRPSRRATTALGEMHVFSDGTFIGLNPMSESTVNVSLVCDPAELRRWPAAEALNRRLARSPHLAGLVEPVPPDSRPGVTFPASARVRTAATGDAALVGDASGFIDPLTGEGIFTALWTAEALARRVIAGWHDLPAALRSYAHARARDQRVKAILCELFQLCISRPTLADGILRLLARRQAAADSFIGIIGNCYSPARGFLRMAGHSLAR
jgi:flavin-dependent dehydrogenase